MIDTLLMADAATPSTGTPSTTATDAGTTVAPVIDQALTDKPAGEAVAQTKAPAGAPETYDFKLPDGVTMDEAGLTSFGELAKDLNLTQEAAQAMLGKLAPAMQARQAQAREAASTQWAQDSRADTEFGGAKLAENVALAAKALEQFGTPALKTLLQESGLGNHPEIIRAFYRAGKAISADTAFVNGAAAGSSVDPAKRMFPSMK